MRYKFTELSTKSKDVAVCAYLDGWAMTHGAGDMTYDDAYSACIDINDEMYYNEDGTDHEDQD